MIATHGRDPNSGHRRLTMAAILQASIGTSNDGVIEDVCMDSLMVGWQIDIELLDLPDYGVIWKVDASHLILASATRVSFVYLSVSIASQLSLSRALTRLTFGKNCTEFPTKM